MEHPERAASIRKGAIRAFLIWLGVWLLCALWLRPWRLVDVPLWLGENVVRVVDFADVMESFDIHWHQVPRELPESTLTFFCRFWIAVAISILLGWRTARAKIRPLVVQEEPPPLERVARFGIAAILIAVLIGADFLLATRTDERIVELTAAACGDDSDRAEKALAAIRRLGPNAHDAIEPLAKSLHRVPDRRASIVETLGHLGPDSITLLGGISLRGDLAEPEVAVTSLRHIGPRSAPMLAAVWKETKLDRVKTAAEAGLRDFGLAAMPYLIETTDRANSALHLYWFNELDRNWTLRTTSNRTVLALRKLQGADLLTTQGNAQDLIRESGSAAVPLLATSLRDKNTDVRKVAAWELGGIGTTATEAVDDLLIALTDQEWVVRSAAAEALGKIAPNAGEALSALFNATVDTDVNVRSAAAEALRKAGARSIADLVKALVRADYKARDAAPKLLETIDPDWQDSEKVRQVIPILITALTSDDSRVCRGASEVLGMIGPSASEAVPFLTTCLASEDVEVRRVTAKTLGKIGPGAKEAVPELIKTLMDMDVHTYLGATDSLKAIDLKWHESDHARQAIPRIINALSDRDEKVRYRAGGALEQFGPSADEAVPHLVKALADKEGRVRQVAAFALGKIGPSASGALPALMQQSRTDNFRAAQDAATTAIRQIRGN
jgi:HEAT repeat protein